MQFNDVFVQSTTETLPMARKENQETATSCRQHMYHQASSCWSRWLLVAHLEVAVHSTVMDQKKHSSNSPNRRMKRPAPTSGAKVLVVEDNAHWDCSVCTYRNTEEAFKCLMCDVRKGTSTRKPRISPQIAAQQYNPTPAIVSAKNLKKEVGGSGGKEGLSGRDRKNSSSSGTGAKASVAGIMRKSRRDKNCPPRLKNVDRSTAQTWEVTVNNVTVVVTEYKPKSKTRSGSQLGLSGAPTAEQDRERTGVGAGGGAQMSSASSENGSQSGEESSVDLARGSGGDLGTDSRSS